jgi:serine phosphatase RsbU (regulator of sigma subunit)
MFTDGITEAQDASGEFLGRERLLELLKQPGKASIALPDRIAAAVLEYIGDAKQFDDITIVAVRRKW